MITIILLKKLKNGPIENVFRRYSASKRPLQSLESCKMPSKIASLRCYLIDAILDDLRWPYLSFEAADFYFKGEN